MSSVGAGLAIGLDLGGTEIKGALVDRSGEVVVRLRGSTGPDGSVDAVRARLETLAERLFRRARGRRVAGIGIGVCGLVDVEAGRFLGSPILPQFRDVPLAAHLEDRFGLPARLENDANAAALGETWVGSGRGARLMTCFTIGTGIGGAIVHEGRLLRGAQGFAGEFGHITVSRSGRRCRCGNRGCVGGLASSEGILAAFARQRNGRSRVGAGFRDVLRAARRGDAAARAALDTSAQHLGVAVAIVTNALDPDRVVLSGGVTAAGRPWLDRVRAEVARRVFPETLTGLRITRGKLGSFGGTVGAAALILRPEGAS